MNKKTLFYITIEMGKLDIPLPDDGTFPILTEFWPCYKDVWNESTQTYDKVLQPNATIHDRILFNRNAPQPLYGLNNDILSGVWEPTPAATALFPVGYATEFHMIPIWVEPKYNLEDIIEEISVLRMGRNVITGNTTHYPEGHLLTPEQLKLYFQRKTEDYV